jgi:hypothetical protein
MRIFDWISSLGILVWGYTKHGDAHITVTPVLKYRKIKAQINDFPPAHILNIASFRF